MRKNRPLPSSSGGRAHSDIHVLIVNADEYTCERIRIALASDPAWILHRITSGELTTMSLFRDGPAVVLAPAENLPEIEIRPFIFPVLGTAPPGLFDVVPEDFCDDLIASNWTADELRYRLRRLVVQEHTHIGSGTFKCTPSMLTSGDRQADLTISQYRLLAMLIRAKSASVPREALAAALMNARSSTDNSRALDMHISRLRRKLRAVTGDWQIPPEIAAHRGGGYSLG